MPDIPKAALAAAAEALAVHFNPANTMSVGEETRAALVESWELEARLALEAATPVLAAHVAEQVAAAIEARRCDMDAKFCGDCLCRRENAAAARQIGEAQ